MPERLVGLHLLCLCLKLLYKAVGDVFFIVAVVFVARIHSLASRECIQYLRCDIIYRCGGGRGSCTTDPTVRLYRLESDKVVLPSLFFPRVCRHLRGL